MSKTHRSPKWATAPSWLTLARVAKHLAARAAQAIASSIVRRAARQAHRELAALDDRMLADIGVVRAELTSLLDTLAEARADALLA